MDRLIKEALEQRAAEITVPADAWEKQRALLRRAGVAGGAGAVGATGAARRPWWRRLANLAEIAAVAALMVGLVMAGVAYGPLGPGPGGGERKGGTKVGDLIAPPPDTPPDRSPSDVNPVIIPGPRVVDEPPPGTRLRGYLTQDHAIEAARAALLEHEGLHGGPLTLTSIDLREGKWELKYKTDWRVFARSEGERPADPRRPEASALVPVTEVTVLINDDEGQGKAFFITTDPSQLTGLNLQLQRYRGRIVSGGEQMILRLTSEDGTWEGRDLTVWVLRQALGKSGMHLDPNDKTLKLWHLIYGAGREITVYGLPIGPSEVLAYGLWMEKRPVPSLADHALFLGAPLPTGAEKITDMTPPGAGYRLKGMTVGELIAWYEGQMPSYNWGLKESTTVADMQILRYQNDAWKTVTVGVYADTQSTRFDVVGGDVQLPVRDQQQAVSAVFRELGDDPAYRQFPRSPGSAQGSINIGGPAPGQTIPATYETRVRQLSSGEWDVELVRIWAPGRYHRYRFQVTPEGMVLRLGELGEQPPAIP